MPDVAYLCQYGVTCDVNYRLDWAYTARKSGLDCAILDLKDESVISEGEEEVVSEPNNDNV